MCSLQMTGIAWTVPAPMGEPVPPSAALGSDPPMMNWEKITDRLKTLFPQQTRYLSLYLVVSTDQTLVRSHNYSNATFQRKRTHTYTHTSRYFFYHGLGKKMKFFKKG